MKEKRLTGFMLAAVMISNTAVGALAYDYTDNSVSARQLPTGDLSIPKSIRIDLADNIDLSYAAQEVDLFTVSESTVTDAQASTGGSSGGSGGGTVRILKLYNTMPNHGYSYEYLAQFDSGAEMQKCYDGILQMCKDYVKSTSNHEDGNFDIFNWQAEVDKLKNGVETEHVYNLTGDETNIVFFAFMQDHPEFWWLDKSYLCITGTMQNDVPIAIPVPMVYSDYASFDYRKSLNESINSQFCEYLDKVLALPKQDSYTVAKFVHDKIAENVEYGYLKDEQGNYILDDNGEKIPLDTAYAHSIVGVLDGDSNTDPVCESYAKAYQLIMTAAGQKCLFVTGLANGGGHGWNLVELNDKYYYVDATWDDIDNESGSTVVDEYFAKGSTTYAADHKVFTPDLFLTPEEAAGLTTAQQWLKCTAYFMPELTVPISDADYDDAYDAIRIEYVNIQTAPKDAKQTVPGIRVSIKKQADNANLFVVTYNEDNTVRKIYVKDLDNEQWNEPYISHIEDPTSPSKIKAFLWEKQNFKPVAKSKGILWTPR